LKERLQKILSRAGVASRRAAEQWMLAGRVRVNGVVVKELGSKADAQSDEIRIDGRLISSEVEKIYLMLHKPQGFVTTLRDPEGRPTVADLVVGVAERVYPVGRLDYDSEGLLLLTNDGDFSQKVQHPRHQVPKTYRVKVRGTLAGTELRSLEQGVSLDGELFRPAKMREEKENRGSTWLLLTIAEGRNRIIRRAFEALGHPVARLIRLKIGEVALGSLPSGEYRHLTAREVESLRSAAR